MLIVSWLIDVAFFGLLWVLVTRDRRIVIRELLGEVGDLLQPTELRLVSSYATLGWRNTVVLFTQGIPTWRRRRDKQLALVELALPLFAALAGLVQLGLARAAGGCLKVEGVELGLLLGDA